MAHTYNLISMGLDFFIFLMPSKDQVESIYLRIVQPNMSNAFVDVQTLVHLNFEQIYSLLEIDVWLLIFVVWLLVEWEGMSLVRVILFITKLNAEKIRTDEEDEISRQIETFIW